MATFGEKLKAVRLHKEMSQEELANLLGTTKQTISRYETEVNSPRLDTVSDISKELDIEMNLLIDSEYSTRDVISALDKASFTAPKKINNISPQRQFLMDKLAKATDEDVERLAKIWELIDNEE